MTKKKLFKFSKGVTILCIVMDVLLTVKNVILEFMQIPLDASIVIAEYAAFSVELGYNAMIKLLERKNKQEDTDGIY